MIKSLEPYERKINADTWYYAKRCFVALAETLAKNMVLLKDEAFEDIVAFFDAAAFVGKGITLDDAGGADASGKSGGVGGASGGKPGSSSADGKAGISEKVGKAGGSGAPGSAGGPGDDKKNAGPRTVAKEARLLKKFFLKMRD